MISDNQQAFLKFLWWNNGNLLKEQQYFVICAHVFGGTSSSNCLKYALRITAIDNESIEALLNKVYVDDLLKSSKNVESAKEFVKDVMNMCKAGEFHLTKFILNNKELLLSIP